MICESQSFLNKLLLGILLFFVADAQGVIVVVHGTFATAESWHQADGDFVQALRSSFVHLPDGCSQKNTPIISFSWTGANCSSARIAAAKNLAALILSYPESEKIQLVAHSHAGNVVALATQFLKKSIETPVATREVTEMWPTLQEASDLVGLVCTTQDRELLRAAIVELAVFSRAKYTKTRSVETEGKKIQRVYFLATPVDVSRYACEMSMVETCYALFSKGDLIQPVAGFYQRIFPQGPRFLNIEVVMLVSDKKYQTLGHADLRKPRIGSWLLLLPYLIEKGIGLKPENYGEHKNIVLALLVDGSKPIVATCLLDEHGKLSESLKTELIKRVEGGRPESSGYESALVADPKYEKRPADPFPVLI